MIDANLQRLFSEMAEELLPELEPYLETGAMGAQLRHPLVYQVPLSNKGGANRLYLQKVAETERALAEGNYKQYVWLHERPYRLEAFCKNVAKLSNRNYWELLSAIWIDTENAWQNIDLWRTLFDTKRPDKARLMDEESYYYFTKLPDEITLYRGCQRGVNETGLSWTFDKDKAKFFATRLRKENSIIIQATVKKPDVVAIFLDRNEQEAIITRMKTIDTWWDV